MNIAHTWDKYVELYHNGDITVMEAALIFLIIADESNLHGIMDSMDDFLLEKTFKISQGIYENLGLQIFPPVKLNPKYIELIYHWFSERNITY